MSEGGHGGDETPQATPGRRHSRSGSFRFRAGSNIKVGRCTTCSLIKVQLRWGWLLVSIVSNLVTVARVCEIETMYLYKHSFVCDAFSIYCTAHTPSSLTFRISVVSCRVVVRRFARSRCLRSTSPVASRRCGEKSRLFPTASAIGMPRGTPGRAASPPFGITSAGEKYVQQYVLANLGLQAVDVDLLIYFIFFVCFRVCSSVIVGQLYSILLVVNKSLCSLNVSYLQRTNHSSEHINNRE